MLTWNDYQNEVKADAIAAIDDYGKDCKDFEDMYDSLWVDDSVTGNGSGSYYFNSANAADAVAGIIFDPDFIAELEGMGYDHVPVEDGAETVDVIARCVALGLVSGELEDYFNKMRENSAA